MTGPLKTMSKTAIERRRVYLDYSCWLAEGEVLSDFEVAVSPYTAAAPISVDTVYPNDDQTKLMMFVGGGVANAMYTLSVVIRTDAGQVKQDNFGLRISPPVHGTSGTSGGVVYGVPGPPGPPGPPSFPDVLDNQNYVRTLGNWVLGYTKGAIDTLLNTKTPRPAETRNRVVNPAMQISQENGFDVAVSNGAYPADQWLFSCTTGGVPTAFSRATDGPEKYIRVNAGNTIDTAIAAADTVLLTQRIEGINTADFLWGTANAKPVVLRFTARVQVITSLVIGVSLRGPAGARSFVKNITLTSAWQDFVIPIPGDTLGTWPVDTSYSTILTFTGMAGSTWNGGTDGVWTGTNSIAAPGNGNIMAAVQSCMDIKNVGLYLDPNNTGLAPPWQLPDEAEELRACRRYYAVYNYTHIVMAVANAASQNIFGGVQYQTAMRAVPAVTNSNVTYSNGSGWAWNSLGLDGARGFFPSVAAGPAYATMTNVIVNARL